MRNKLAVLLVARKQMRGVLRVAATIGAGIVLALGMTTGPAAAAGSGNSAAADLAAMKAANGGRDVVRVNNMVAAGGMNACSSGSFCAWADAYYSDGPGQWSGNAANYSYWGHSSCLKGLGTWDNCASSVYNNGTHCNIQLFDRINYDPADGYYNLAKGGHLANLTLDKMTDGNPMNDRISSHEWCTW